MTTYKDNVKAKISRIFSTRRFIKGAWLLESVEFKSIPFINETRLLPLSLRPVVGRHLNRRLKGFSFLFTSTVKLGGVRGGEDEAEQI